MTGGRLPSSIHGLRLVSEMRTAAHEMASAVRPESRTGPIGAFAYARKRMKAALRCRDAIAALHALSSESANGMTYEARDIALRLGWALALDELHSELAPHRLTRISRIATINAAAAEAVGHYLDTVGTLLAYVEDGLKPPEVPPATAPAVRAEAAQRLRERSAA